MSSCRSNIPGTEFVPLAQSIRNRDLEFDSAQDDETEVSAAWLWAHAASGHGRRALLINAALEAASRVVKPKEGCPDFVINLMLRLYSVHMGNTT